MAPSGARLAVMATTYVSLSVHIVFATKGRVPIIADEWRPDLHAYFGGTVRSLGAHPTIVGGTADHIHALIGLRTTHCLADLVREVKKASSVWARERQPSFAWQTGYGAFSVSPGHINRVVEYIANQEEHHRKASSADELRALLIEHGLEIDERFFE